MIERVPGWLRRIPLWVALAALGVAVFAVSPANTSNANTSTDNTSTKVTPGAFIKAALARDIAGVDHNKAFECWKKLTCETGRGTLTVALADGFGDNVWRQFTRMDFVLQALTYPEVKKIIYLNGHGDPQQSISNIQSLISQQVDVIITYPDSGVAMLPIIKQATKRGIKVVPYGASVTGRQGTDYVTRAHPGTCTWAKKSAQRIISQFGNKATVMFLSGTPGNLQSPEWQKCAKQQFAGSSVKIVGPQDTNWTQEGALKATSALLAQNPKIDAVMYEYANGALGSVRAFQQAKRPLPSFFFFTEDNGLFGQWVKLHKSQPKFKIVFTNGGNKESRIALSAAIAAKHGQPVPPDLEFSIPLIDLKPSMYKPQYPGEYPYSTDLPVDLIKRMFAS